LALLDADENFPHPTVVGLRRLGHDVLTAREAGRADREIDDTAVLAFAHARARAVLTQNRKHSRNLHHSGHEHSGIIICTVDPDFDGLAARIDAAIARLGSLVGQLVRVVRPPI
jgi:hypothetical protein